MNRTSTADRVQSGRERFPNDETPAMVFEGYWQRQAPRLMSHTDTPVAPRREYIRPGQAEEFEEID